MVTVVHLSPSCPNLLAGLPLLLLSGRSVSISLLLIEFSSLPVTHPIHPKPILILVHPRHNPIRIESLSLPFPAPVIKKGREEKKQVQKNVCQAYKAIVRPAVKNWHWLQFYNTSNTLYSRCLWTFLKLSVSLCLLCSLNVNPFSSCCDAQ